MKKTVLATAAVATLAATVLIVPAAWAESGRVTARVALSVGSSPHDVAFSPDGTHGYVTNYDSNTISFINAGSDEVYDYLDLPGSPRSIAISPDGGTALVTMPADGGVAIIALDTWAVGTIKVPGNPSSVAISPLGTVAYVTNEIDSTVAVIDLIEGRVVDTIDVGLEPRDVAFSPDGAVAYVANYGDASVSVIDADSGTVSKSIELESGRTSAVAFAPDGGTAYVSHEVGGVSIIDATTDTYRGLGFGAGTSPSAVAVSPDSSTVYVTNRNDNSVSVYDVLAGTVTDTLSVESEPIAVAFNPAGRVAYVVNLSSNSVTPLIRAVSSTSIATVSVAVTSGALTTRLSDVNFGSIPFSHGAQYFNADTMLFADDQTGLRAGWGVTMQASALVWTGPDGTTDETFDIAADRLSLFPLENVITDAGDDFIGSTLDGATALNSEVGVFSAGAGDGNGSYEVPLTVQLAVPANALAGTYVGTLTTTISAAP